MFGLKTILTDEEIKTEILKQFRLEGIICPSVSERELGLTPGEKNFEEFIYLLKDTSVDNGSTLDKRFIHTYVAAYFRGVERYKALKSESQESREQ